MANIEASKFALDQMNWDGILMPLTTSSREASIGAATPRVLVSLPCIVYPELAGMLKLISSEELS